MAQMAEDEVLKRSGSARVLRSVLGVFRTLPAFTGSRSSHLARLSVPACVSASASCVPALVLTAGAVLGFRSERFNRSFNPYVLLGEKQNLYRLFFLSSVCFTDFSNLFLSHLMSLNDD